MRREEQFEFSQSVEGLFIHGLGDVLTPAMRAVLKEQGLDLNQPLKSQYSAADFHRWIDTVAGAIYPDEPKSDAVRLIGHHAAAGLQRGLVGRALASGLKLIGPKRSFQRVERIFKSGNNYLVATLISLDDTTATVTLSDVYGLPSYYQGLFEYALKVIGARAPRVTVQPMPGPGATLSIEWDP